MKKKSDSKFGGKKCVTFSVCDGTQDATSISTMFIWSNYRCINYLIFVDHKLNNIWLKLKYCKQHNHNLVYYRLVDNSSATERQVQTNYYALRYDGQMRVSRFCVSTSLLLLCIDGDWSSQVERQWIFIFFVFFKRFAIGFLFKCSILDSGKYKIFIFITHMTISHHFVSQFKVFSHSTRSAIRVCVRACVSTKLPVN